MDVSQMLAAAVAARPRFAQARSAIGDEFVWYQYDILGSLAHLDALLHDRNRDLDALTGGLPVADIGGADGDLAFLLEHEAGWQVDLIENALTNQNGLRGARALRDYFGSEVRIEDVDLDKQFGLPRDRYGLVLLLGVLYHLQNPFFVLRELSLRSDHCLLSTRVAQYAGAARTLISHIPVAYLVGPHETNNDATNYWVFSAAGLEQIVRRAGWTVVERMSVGDTVASNPASPHHDERVFMLLRSMNRDECP